MKRYERFSERLALTVAMIVLIMFIVVMGGAAFKRFRSGENV